MLIGEGELEAVAEAGEVECLGVSAPDFPELTESADRVEFTAEVGEVVRSIRKVAPADVRDDKMLKKAGDGSGGVLSDGFDEEIHLVKPS